MFFCYLLYLLRFSSNRDANARRERYDSSYRNRPGFRERERELDSDMRMYEKIRFVNYFISISYKMHDYLFILNRYQQQAYAAYGPATAASFYAPELYGRSSSTSYMTLPPYSVSADWHPPVTDYRREYERRPRNNS